MNSDDEVCLCFHVTVAKVRSYLRREDPPVASLISECLGAGTGCGWCVPQLRRLHELHCEGRPIELEQTAEDYSRGREAYRAERRVDSADDSEKE
ncbi:MAG: (2Fe-2S)-binding protein [Phycisphaerales bacterium JB038]